MESEHCKKAGSRKLFHAANYDIKTCPADEWGYVVLRSPVPEEQMSHNRKIPKIEDLKQLDLTIQANLKDEEIIAVVQYTGPMVRSVSF